MYCKVDEDWKPKANALAVVTGEWAGQIPPVTICEQENDLRVDVKANIVTTYVFRDLGEDLEVSIEGSEVDVIRGQTFDQSPVTLD